MKSISIRRLINAVLAITAMTAACIFLAPQVVEAKGIMPVILTQGNYTQTVNGVTFTLRHDYAHPYYQFTDAYAGYNRMLVINMQIKNGTNKPFNYTALANAYDANRKQLANSNALAAAEFGVVEPGKTVEVTNVYLLKKTDNVFTYSYTYNHMDYSASYFNDMNLYLSGALTLADLQARYQPVPVTFNLTNPGY